MEPVHLQIMVAVLTPVITGAIAWAAVAGAMKAKISGLEKHLDQVVLELKDDIREVRHNVSKAHARMDTHLSAHPGIGRQ